MSELILHHLLRHAERIPDRVAYTAPRDGRRISVTWAEHVAAIRQTARAFVALGLQPGETVGILGVTRPEWTMGCLAAQLAGGLPSGIYQTCSAEQIAYIAAHARNRLMVIENEEQWRKVDAVRDRLTELRRVIIMKSSETPDDELALSWNDFLELGGDENNPRESEVQSRLDALDPEDLGTLIYTSGTTGHPKAVMLTHANLAETGRICVELLKFTYDDSLVSYLPLAHVAEQNVSIHLPARVGLTVHYAEAPELLLQTLQEVEPTFFFGVPRVWERFHAALTGRLATAPGRQRALVDWAMGAVRDLHVEIDAGRRPRLGLRLRHTIADRLLAKIRKKIGFGRIRLATSGAAPIARDVLDFFAGLGTPIYEVWGLSETTGPATWNSPGRAKQGTVGPAIPDVEVELAEDGELLVRGPNVFAGYYRDEAGTSEVLRDDGFFHTGDLGSIDEDGFVTITGRKKEILITSGGKNIAPAPIERRLKRIELVGDAMVVGDDRRFLGALLSLEEEAAARFANRHGLEPADLHHDPTVLAKLEKEIDSVNQQLARVESIRAFRVLPRRLSQQEGELTPTLKVKRGVVMERFRDLVEEMYS
ncbi:MAG: long-chain fatty acid--CoA ligase [Thermoanaerobaculia bacterium]|nr:long-chain fatty acid--CoA ligase [Thermoanaerobaculia bacterium]